MYIKKLVIHNIRCFEHFEIDFTDKCLSTLLLGDNGDGKSTILRSLAIGLCDESSASALFRELPGEFVRRGKKSRYAKQGDSGYIAITLLDDDFTQYRIKTTIKAVGTFERVFQDDGLESLAINSNVWEPLDQDSFPWDKIFVSGYGAGSRTQGTDDLQHYLAVDAVYSVVRSDVPLQNPELAIRRLVEAARKSRKDPAESEKRASEMLSHITEILSGLLQLSSKESIVLGRSGIEVRGPWGHAELGELGDGYRATVTWVLDMLAWWFLRISSRGGYHVKNIKGIVFVDEIEQHLHPRWQRKIIPLLQSAFPEIQFILSTHSPLCAAGTADVGEEKYQIVHMNRVNGKVEPKLIALPIGYRADQILTSDAFGLSDTRNPETEKKISRYRELSGQKDLDSDEKKELDELRIIMQNVPEVGQFEEERKLRSELRELIKIINSATHPKVDND